MKRRNFIKTTSCVTVGALLPNSNIIYGTEKNMLAAHSIPRKILI